MRASAPCCGLQSGVGRLVLPFGLHDFIAPAGEELIELCGAERGGFEFYGF